MKISVSTIQICVLVIKYIKRVSKKNKHLTKHWENKSTSMSFEYGVTSRGKPTVIYRSFEYVKEKDNVSGTVSWRCRSYHNLKCKARLVTCGSTVVSNRQPDHNHSGNIASSHARKAVGDMKLKMTELGATPSAVQASVMSQVADNVLMALPNRTAVSLCLRRHKRKVTSVASGGRPLPAVPTDLLFDIPEEFADVIVFDSGLDENRLILISCPELLDALARASLWLADGTFKVVPTLFFQLYSIHFDFGNGVCPAAVYCLLTNKSAATYTRLHDELRNLIPTAAPGSVLVDFERAAINTFSTAYPTAQVSGCYFHLCQSVVRKVNEVGLKSDYENNDEVRVFVRCLPALAFIPPQDVIEAFERLVEAMPQGIDHLDELVTFFEHTYIRGRRLRGRGDNYGPALFPVEVWNQHAAGVDGIARTTNSVEGWHHGLQSLFQCHHPTLWNFLSGIKQDLQQQKARLLQGATGMQHPSKKRYRCLNDRVKRTVAAYGRTDVLLYLRSIAHLSHV